MNQKPALNSAYHPISPVAISRICPSIGFTVILSLVLEVRRNSAEAQHCTTHVVLRSWYSVNGLINQHLIWLMHGLCM